MSPIALLIIQVLVRYGPEVAEQVKALLEKTDPPTIEEWNALFAKAREKDYHAYVPDSGLPPRVPGGGGQ